MHAPRVLSGNRPVVVGTGGATRTGKGLTARRRLARHQIAPHTFQEARPTQGGEFSHGLSHGGSMAFAAAARVAPQAKSHLTQPACVAKRAAQRLSCTDIGCVLEICLIIPMKRRSKRINDYFAELKRRQRTHLACCSEASSQLCTLQGCCHRQPVRRRQWSLEHEVLPRQATSFETTRCIGTQTAAAGNMAMMRDLSELVGAQWVSRARCLSLSVRRPGELYMASWRPAGL